MKTLPILNMIPQFNLNLRLAHKDTLKEIYHRLARMIMGGDRIKRSQYMKNASGIIGRAGRDVGYSSIIEPKEKIYCYGESSIERG